MKTKTQMIFLLVFSTILAAAVMAQAALENTPKIARNPIGMVNMDIDAMEKMHDEMTKGLPREMEEIMDKMHENCIKMHEDPQQAS